MINFIRAYQAIQRCARQRLDTRQQSVLLALFDCMNERQFPDGMVAISNKELLAHTGLAGSRADRALRELRQQLADMGLIRFTPGSRNSADPAYRIEWETLGIRETAPGQPAAASAAVPDTASHFAAQNCCKKGPSQYYVSPKGIYINNAKGRGKRHAPQRAELPSVDQVRAYCEVIGYSLNPLKFIDYYAARGQRLDDWQAALRVWKYRDEEQQRGMGKRVSAQCYTQREYPPEYWERIEQQQLDDLIVKAREIDLERGAL